MLAYLGARWGKVDGNNGGMKQAWCYCCPAILKQEMPTVRARKTNRDFTSPDARACPLVLSEGQFVGWDYAPVVGNVLNI